MKTLLCLSFLFIVNCLTAQNVPLVSEIYDFEIGDEFHYSSSGFDNSAGGGGSYNNGRETYQIVNKWHSLNLDSVFYVRKINGDRYHRHGSINNGASVWEKVDTIAFSMNATITHVIPCIIDSLFNPNPFGFDSNLNCIDTVYIDTTGWTRIHELSGTDWYLDGTYTIYAAGLGKVADQEDNSYYSHQRTFLEYYKKDTIECGTPLLYVGMKESESPDDVFIYPNPVSEKLHLINSGLPPVMGTARIYSINGVELMNSTIKRGKDFLLDVSELNSGIYFLQISTDAPRLNKSFTFIKN